MVTLRGSASLEDPPSGCTYTLRSANKSYVLVRSKVGHGKRPRPVEGTISLRPLHLFLSTSLFFFFFSAPSILSLFHLFVFFCVSTHERVVPKNVLNILNKFRVQPCALFAVRPLENRLSGSAVAAILTRPRDAALSRPPVARSSRMLKQNMAAVIPARSQTRRVR